MKSRYALAFVPLMTLLCVGCSATQSSSTAPVAPDELPAIRAETMKANPYAAVALVTAVAPNESMAYVGFARAGDFGVGDFVSLADRNETLVANAKVTDVKGDTITVQYLPPPKGQRPPQAGDLAIHFK